MGELGSFVYRVYPLLQTSSAHDEINCAGGRNAPCLNPTNASTLGSFTRVEGIRPATNDRIFWRCRHVETIPRGFVLCRIHPGNGRAIPGRRISYGTVSGR